MDQAANIYSVAEDIARQRGGYAYAYRRDNEMELMPRALAVAPHMPFIPAGRY